MTFERNRLFRHAVRLLPALPFSVMVHLYYHHQLRFFRRPRTFTEMVAAKKLHDPNPLYALTASKSTVRPYVRERIGDKYLVALFCEVEDAREIDFGALPDSFVLKASHGSGMNLIVADKSTFDSRAAVRSADEWMQTDYYHRFKEPVYRGMKRSLLVEEFIGGGDRPPDDYKLFVINGRVVMIEVDSDRFGDHRQNFFTADWREFAIERRYPRLLPAPSRPENLVEMVEVAERLADGIEFVRVDLYDTGDRVYFGEMTHFPAGGTRTFTPRSFDRALGELWRQGTPIPTSFMAEDLS